MAMPKDASSLWAWVSEYPDGSTGTISVSYQDKEIPLICRSHFAIEQFRRLARQHQETHGQRVWLRQYTKFIDHGNA